MDLDEGTKAFHVFAHGAAGGGVRRDRRADGDAAVLGDLGGDIADAADVQIAVLFAKAQFRRQVLADNVPIQQRDGTAAHLHQLHHQSIGDCRFPRAGETGEEDGKALLVARRLGAAQLFNHLGEGEPFGDFQPFLQTATQLGARDVEDGDVILVFDLVNRLVLRALGHPNHMFEVDHFDAHFFLMSAEQILRVIGAIEIITGRVLAGARVVAAHDEMGAAVVLADQTVPHGLAGAGHAHGEVQQAHRGGGGRVFVQHGLVAAHAGKVVHIAGLGQADNGVDQQVRLRFTRGAEGQFLVRAVQGVAGLEGHNLAPAHLAKIGTQLVRRVATRLEIIVDGLLDASHRAAQIDVARGVVQIVHRRMRAVIRAKDFLCLAGLVWNPAVGDGHDRQNHAFLIAQRNVLPDLEPFGKLLGHIKVDRHRPQRPICQTHVFDNTVIVFFGQETLKRVEATVHQQL